MMGCSCSASPAVREDAALNDVGAARADVGAVDAGALEADPRIFQPSCELVARPSSPPPAAGQPGWSGCERDEDCMEGRAGRCLQDGPIAGTCTYHECETDADCGEGSICGCAIGPLEQNVCLVDRCTGVCEREACAVSAGCDGELGLIYGANDVACRTPADECASDADCDSQVCTRNPSSVETLPRFECVGVCVR
ncbi:MAG TPA: hypothetical protein RMG95_03535 [Polyangiaceae bacterium LLY-WYZ-15_(1-7)]|nr:hypothetical protein [Polyangiaceae bacterium LLY-WYZ-15_(1-7)]